MGVSGRIIKGILLAALTFVIGVAMVGLLRTHHAAKPAQMSAPAISSKQNEEPKELSAPCRIKELAVTYDRVASLREIDFKNLVYPGTSSCEGMPEEAFHLRMGWFGNSDSGMKLSSISFGDVSGDGQDEAIATLHELSDGSGVCDAVYVFALEDGHPKVIYLFESGDRAQGGLRRAYAEGGRFVVELWGPGNTLERTYGSDGTGLCCPLTFTRTRYQWLNQTFQQDGSPEILSNPRAKAQCPTCDH